MSSITSPSAATTVTAATPSTRNRVVDATRAVAMLAVVVGHWLVALPTAGANGSIGGINALEQLRSFQVRSIEANAQRWLQKPKVWMAVALINLRIMTVYLWHFTALIIASVIVIPSAYVRLPDLDQLRGG